jgi:hypothetical protein
MDELNGYYRQEGSAYRLMIGRQSISLSEPQLFSLPAMRREKCSPNLRLLDPVAGKFSDFHHHVFITTTNSNVAISSCDVSRIHVIH